MMKHKKTYKWIITVAAVFVVCLISSQIREHYENKRLNLDGLTPLDLENPQFESIDEKEEYIVKININTADEDMLCELPNIGTTTAKNIIEFRESSGNFTDIREITMVRGIGEKTFAEISKYLTVE